MQLKKIQSSFAKSIFQNDNEEITAEIKFYEIENEARFQLYKDNVLLTLYETLKSIYPTICKLTGKHFFKYMANDYIKNNPPISGNLDDYGTSFFSFLKSFAPAKELPYLSDIAKLEWAIHLAYFAADAPKIDALALSKIPPEQLENLKFKLHPSAQIISASYPIDKIFSITEEDSEIDISEHGAEILVIRPELKTTILLLENGEFEFLTSLQNNESLYLAFENALSKNPNFDVGSALHKFLLNGTFVDFTPTQSFPEVSK